MITKEEIEKRMDELWEKLPNADSPEDTWTKEELIALGAFMALEKLTYLLSALNN